MSTRMTWMSGLVIVGLSGCLGRGQTDLLQARLRDQQQLLAEAQAERDAAQSELRLARKETEGLRTQLAQANQGLLPEQSDLLVRASGLRINSWLTAGFDRDEAYGDDLLVVHFEPVDDRGEPIRLPGAVQIRAVDPTLPEESQTVAEWNFTAEEAREKWIRGLLGSGYQFTLPWEKPPENPELVIHVRLRPADGRDFAAAHVVKITPPQIAGEGPEVLPASSQSKAFDSAGKSTLSSSTGSFTKATAKPATVRKTPALSFDASEAGAAESGEMSTGTVLQDSSGWMKDDAPSYR